MSGAAGSRTKRTDYGRHPVPYSRALAQAARDRKSTAARETGRAVQRAVDRHNAVSDGDEFDLLHEQLDALDELSDEDSAQEYAIIQARFGALAARQNSKAALEANKEFRFCVKELSWRVIHHDMTI
jgi:hypothetical protein